MPATICVPEAANPVKVASMRALGAQLVFHGRDFDDAREMYRDYLEFIAHPANGFSTMTLPFTGGLEFTVRLTR